MIRDITDGEIVDVVQLHRKILPSFLSAYPSRFIEKFYRSQLWRKNQLLLGYFENNQLQGFVFGTDHVEKLYGDFIAENRLYFYLQTIITLLLNPKYIVLQAGRLVSKSKPSLCKRQLVYIAVNPRSETKGIGSLLLHEFEKRWEKFGYYELEVRSDNKALNFYLKHNFEIVSESKQWVETKLLLGKKLK